MENDEALAGDGEAAAAAAYSEEQANPEMEKRARDMGWSPKSEWRGKDEDWRSAEEFVRRGEEVLPIVNAENKRLRAELASLKSETDETIKRVQRMSETALKRQRVDLESRFETLKRQAVEQGDTKAYDAADKSQKAALKSFDEEAAEQSAQPGKPDGTTLTKSDKETLQTWLGRNSWFNSSNMLRGAADDAHAEIMAQYPGMPLADRLEKVRERVAEMFPDKFGRSNGNGAAMVEGSQGRDSGGGDAAGGALWSRVPSAAKQQADHFIKEERLYDSAIGADPSKPHTPKQLAQARELYAKEFLQEAV